MKTTINKLIISTLTLLVLIPTISSARTLNFASVPSDFAAIHNEAFPFTLIKLYDAAYSTRKAHMVIINADFDRCMSTGSNAKECVYMKELGTYNVNAMFDSKLSSIASNFTE